MLGIAGDLEKMGGKIDGAIKKFKELGAASKSLFLGAGSIGLGLGIMATLKPAIDAASRLQAERAKLRQLGLNAGQVDDLTGTAKHEGVRGSTFTNNLANIGDAVGILREAGIAGPRQFDGAKIVGPLLSKLDVIAKNNGKEMSHEGKVNLIRDVEMRGGLTDAATFASVSEGLFKLIGSSGGGLDAGILRQIFANGGVAVKNQSQDSLDSLEPIMSELKGRFGTGMMTMYNRLTGGTKVPNQIADMLMKGGIWDASKITRNHLGGVKTINGNPLEGSDLFKTDIVQWERTYLEAFFKRQNITDQSEKDRIDNLVGGRTGGQVLSEIQRKANVIDLSRKSVAMHQGVNDSLASSGQTKDGAMNAIKAAWDNVLTNLGGPLIGPAVGGLNALADALQGFAKWTTDNPTAVKVIALGTAITGLGLVVGGGIAVIGGALALIGAPFAIAGLAIAGLVAAGIALYVNWGKIVPWLGNLWHSLTDGFAGSIRRNIADFTNLWHGITAGFDWFIGKVKGIWSAFNALTGGPANPTGKTGKGTPDEAPHGTTVGGAGNARMPHVLLPIATTPRPVAAAIAAATPTATAPVEKISNGSHNVRTRADLTGTTVVYADFGQGFERGVTKSVEKIANGMAVGHSGNSYDFSSGRTTPAMSAGG